MCGLGRFVPLTGLFVAAVILSQCQVIGGFAGYEVAEPAQAGRGGGGRGGAPSCDLMSVPSPPVEGAPGGGGQGGGHGQGGPGGGGGQGAGGDVTFALAIRKVNLGESDQRPPGLDIDRACTCGVPACDCASVETCARPAAVSEDRWLRCDDPGGVDANSAKLFRALQAFETPISSDIISGAIELGGGTVLFDVRRYNGEANDDDVSVGVYSAGAFRDAECNGAPVLQPAWDGADAWPIDRDSVIGELPACGGRPSPAVFDVFAYVVEHTLVARLAEVTFFLQLGGVSFQVKLDDVVATAPLDRDDTGKWFTRRAILAGRWRLDELFRSFASIDQLTPIDLCVTQLVSFQDTVCAAADVTTLGDALGPCNAVSFSAEFEAEQAVFGNTIDLPMLEPCPELLDLDCETEVQ